MERNLTHENVEALKELWDWLGVPDYDNKTTVLIKRALVETVFNVDNSEESVENNVNVTIADEKWRALAGIREREVLDLRSELDSLLHHLKRNIENAEQDIAAIDASLNLAGWRDKYK